MKMLFVTSQAQLSGVGGGVTHTASMLALLRSLDGAVIECMELAMPWQGAPRWMRQARALSRAALSAVPSKSHFLLRGAAGQRLARRLAGGAYDAVVLNGADLLPLRKDIPGGVRTILLSHNVESDIIRQKAASARLPGGLNALLAKDAGKTLASEVAGAKSVDLIIAISPEDAAWYRRQAPDTPVVSIPAAFSGPAYDGPRPAISRPLNLAYVAKMSWSPNLEGAQWLVGTVLPHLPQGCCETHLYGPGTEQFAGAAPGLTAHGFVETLDSVWSTAHFALCAILGGSGVNIKLIEALYNGIPVLTTPHGARGLPALSDPALAIVEPEGWSDFLASDAALELAGSRVHEETRELLSVRHAAKVLSEALSAF